MHDPYDYASCAPAIFQSRTATQTIDFSDRKFVHNQSSLHPAWLHSSTICKTHRRPVCISPDTEGTNQDCNEVRHRKDSDCVAVAFQSPCGNRLQPFRTVRVASTTIPSHYYYVHPKDRDAMLRDNNLWHCKLHDDTAPNVIR